MKAVAIGWTAQEEIAHRLYPPAPKLPELYPGQAATVAAQLADVRAALIHRETDAAVLLVGPRAEIRGALDWICPQYGLHRAELPAEGKERQP